MELACSDFTFILDNINGGLPSDPLPRVSLGSGGVGGRMKGGEGARVRDG